MDKAKAAVKDFMVNSGHHDTTVHEKVAPAVQHETVQRTEREELQTAIDKEVHQDHYHTSIQPVKDTAVLPEQHHHNLIPVEHRSFEHGKKEDIEARLAQEAAQFRDETRRVEGEHTRIAAPVVAGEHIHHHVHETIQPVVEKQTLEPHVVHTIVPVHEVHHNAAQHHSASALPAVSLAEFKKQGGSLTGREERYDGFEGEPRNVGGHIPGHHDSPSHHNHHAGAGGLTGRAERELEGDVSGRSGMTGTGSGLTGRAERDLEGRGTGSGLTGTGSGSGMTGRAERTAERDLERDATGTGKKPGLMDRLNPMKDTDHDGKKGFMD